MKEYPISIDPNILELLGPSLYTNIYYILSELIANAWDADASNVWIDVTQASLSIEDDGRGMSYDNKEINKYLSVAKETRRNEDESKTKGYNRSKMGRKGIGKLSALAVSEKVKVTTISEGDKSGFILSRQVPESGKLEPIDEDAISFSHIKENGTKIEMVDPEYVLPKRASTFKRNLVKFFPNVGEDFKVWITVEGDSARNVVLDSFANEVVTSLDTLTTFGDVSLPLIEKASHLSEEFIQRKNAKHLVKLKNKQGQTVEILQEITGWIGTYSSIRGHKKESSDFSQNFLAIYSHNKLGEFNLLDNVGTNRAFDNYIVGQLFIDTFEDTVLPDMALSNRQGYKKDDPRYVEMLKWAEGAVKAVVNLKQKSVNNQKKEEKKRKNNERINLEKDLKKDVSNFIDNFEEYVTGENSKEVLSQTMLAMGAKVIQTKKETKKILISQTSTDEKLNECIYELLKFNGFKPEEIIYSNSLDVKSRLPVDVGIYDYLREFFVKSISDKQIYVIYIVSDNTANAHGVLMEQGAGWIVRSDHSIIKAGAVGPKEPLNIRNQYCEVRFMNNEIFCTERAFVVLHQMIENACRMFNKEAKSSLENRTFFSENFGDILSSEDFNSRITVNDE